MWMNNLISFIRLNFLEEGVEGMDFFFLFILCMIVIWIFVLNVLFMSMFISVNDMLIFKVVFVLSYCLVWEILYVVVMFYIVI